MKNRFKWMLGLTTVGLAAAMANQALASGYRMEFQSASVLADAGDAAVVEDAGTNWYNSAGLVNLPRQLVAGGMLLRVPTRFNGSVFAPSPISPLLSFSTSGRASSTINQGVPLFHYAHPLNDCWALGISVVPAWGFSEDYGRDSILRYSLVRVYTRTIDVAPSLSMRLNPQLSFGIGPDIHYFYVSSKTNVRTEGPFPFGTGDLDSVARFSGERWNFGAHAGLLYQATPCTRIGLNYRTGILMHLKGRSNFLLGGATTSLQNNDFRLKVPLPPTTSLSIYHDINPCWAVMGTVTYDQWAVLNHYHAENIVQPVSVLNPDGLIPSIDLPQKMKNVFDYGIGVHYRWTDKWLFRANAKFLGSPTRTHLRTVTFPDGSKVGVQVGARYQVTPCIAVDGLYGHVWVKKVSVNDFNPVSSSLATGRVKTHIDLVGAQVVWNI